MSVLGGGGGGANLNTHIDFKTCLRLVSSVYQSMEHRFTKGFCYNLTLSLMSLSRANV